MNDGRRRTVAQALGSAVLIALTMLAIAAPADAADQIHVLPGFDSGVTEITPPTAAGVRYVGGGFRRFNSYDTGYGAVFDAATGAINPAFPKVNSLIFTTIPDGAGGFYIGGQFSCVGTVNSDGDCTDAGEYARAGLARISADGSVTAWNPAPSGGLGSPSVKALVLSGSTLYVGGNFTGIGGQSRANIAALDITVNTNNATAWNPGAASGGFMGMMSEVSALVLSGTTLYVGGTFTTLGGAARNRIGALSTSGNSATAWNPNANNAVTALALSGTTLYAGGSFTTIGGASRNRVAALTTLSNTSNATAWNPNANAQVRSLVTDGTTVYAGGDFQTIGGASRNRIAALDASMGAATAWNPDASGQVFGLLLDGTTLYIGGYFDHVGGLLRPGIASLDTTVTSNIVSSWAPTAEAAWAIAKSGSLIFAGGNFREAGGLPREHLAAIDADGHLTAWDPSANSSVDAIGVRGSTIFVAGDFTAIGGESRNGLAAVSEDGTVLPWDPGVAGGTPHALAIAGDKLLIGGYFTSVGGVARTNLAMISLAGSCETTFTAACVTSWNPPTTNPVAPMDGADVDAIAVTGTTALIGGRFTRMDGDPRAKLAALDITDACATSYTKAACLLGWDPQGDGAVKSIAVAGDTVYVAGEFTTLAGASRSRIAALNAGSACRATWSNGSCLVGGWDPGAGDAVGALAVDGTSLYIGGAFTTLGGQTRNHVGAISIGVANGCATTFVAGSCLLSWDPGTDGAPTFNGQVDVIDITGSSMLIGGYFTGVGGTARRYLASIGTDGTLGTVVPSGMLPGAPTATSATVIGTSALVAFTAPTFAGSSPIASYTATCTAATGGSARTQSGAASPLTVSSLTAGATYTCTVTAANAEGTGPASSATSVFTVGGGSDGGRGATDATSASGSDTTSGSTEAVVAMRRPVTIRQAVAGPRKVVVRVRVASAGILRVVGTLGTGRRGARAAGTVVCASTRQVVGPGVPWVTCPLSTAARLMRETSAVRIQLTVTFTPASRGAIERSTKMMLLPRLLAPQTPLLG